MQKGSAEEDAIKITTSPQICCRTTLWNVSGQLYSFCSIVNSVQRDEKHLITINVHEGCYFFVYVHRLIYTMCLKCPLLAHMHVFSREYHWSMDVSIVRCSMLCQIFIFITERNELTLMHRLHIIFAPTFLSHAGNMICSFWHNNVGLKPL